MGAEEHVEDIAPMARRERLSERWVATLHQGEPIELDLGERGNSASIRRPTTVSPGLAVATIT